MLQFIRYLLVFLFLAAVSPAFTQFSCSLSLKGSVKDQDNGQRLPGVTLSADDTVRLQLTDAQSNFSLSGLCAGPHRLLFSCIGYDTLVFHFTLERDTVLQVVLHCREHSLQNVTVMGSLEKKAAISTLAVTELKGQQLFQTRGATVGESLKYISGMNSIQTGPTVSKPIIHGLHSNRVLVLNNGVRQEGQQWGSDHAPEIDPFIASDISVIKGAASVRYGSDALSGVILLDPKPLVPAHFLEGEAHTVAATNGRMGVVSGMLQGKADSVGRFSWRAQGTLKRAGNFSTPNYYLQNTGVAEVDYSLAAAYRARQYGAEVYYSEFYNKVGIFSGSHVGNNKDLDSAIARSKPNVPSYFSYNINRSFQNVRHRLLKASAYYHFTNGAKIELIYAHQRNKRDEYDIDLPYSDDPAVLNMPQVSFEIKTDVLDLVYQQAARNHLSGSFGWSGATQGNVFRGIRYLVPNFRNYSGGLFAIEKYTTDHLTLEAGARYDYRWLRAYRRNNTSLQVYTDTHEYSNLTGTVGATYRFNSQWSVSGNIGTAWRSPSVNELYIEGIHFSDVSYESGDSSLKSERSYNFTLSAKYACSWLTAELVAYNNIIDHFIYAKPSMPPKTTIQGTFPYFKYTQADVQIKGVDLDIVLTPVKNLQWTSKTSILRAWNKKINDYLIYMPADRFDNAIRYTLAGRPRFNNIYLELQHIIGAKQTRVPSKLEFDYAPPPGGYSLFNLHAGFSTSIDHVPVNIDFGLDNLTNVAYRDYLNRFRYFNDELGINAVLRAKISF